MFPGPRIPRPRLAARAESNPKHLTEVVQTPATVTHNFTIGSQPLVVPGGHLSGTPVLMTLRQQLKQHQLE